MKKTDAVLGLLWLARVVFCSTVEDLDLSDPPCCAPDQLLDLEKLQCYDGDLVNSNRTELSIECSSSGSIKAVALESFNQTTRGDNPLYCVHDNSTVLYCNDASLVVRKCCPLGQAVNRTAIGDCAEYSGPFNASAYINPPMTPFTVLPNTPVQCDGADYNIYLPKLFADHRFIINASSNGELIIPAAMYQVLREFDHYCIDQAIDSEGKVEPVAVTCLVSKMELIRYLFWTIYPWLHFISAFLMLLTFCVYAVLPPLRDNIQGYSVMCFLMCMVIVQAEYGAILSIPLRPHTWCFPRVWVSTYFRYASSCWITVMGFNIWSQLANGPRKFSRPQLLKRFGWFSLYAWGVPLILNMIVVGYVESIKAKIKAAAGPFAPPPPPLRCWFGNPVVSHLLSTPNVVLVTANLIFFIPSAIKVYGSLAFLRTSVSSPVALSKLEKDRITTIFRFFLLMQFYTIPRIVHEIVDTDRASPELLIFSVTLYILIGPAMFYFFVCKSEVLRLLTGLGSSVQRKIRALSTVRTPNRQTSTSSNLQTPVTLSTTGSIFFNENNVMKCEDNPAFARDEL